MKNETNEAYAVEGFLESATAAAMESKRLERRIDELDKRLGALRRRKQRTAAKRLSELLGEEMQRERQQIGREMEQYRRVEAFLDRIPDGMCRTILKRRYLEVGVNWTEIQDGLAQDGMFYSQRHLVRLFTRALEQAQRLWDGEGGTERR